MVVVTVYKRADGKTNTKVSSKEVRKRNKLGYNPAMEAKGFTEKQATAARSKEKTSAWALGKAEKKVEARF